MTMQNQLYTFDFTGVIYLFSFGLDNISTIFSFSVIFTLALPTVFLSVDYDNW